MARVLLGVKGMDNQTATQRVEKTLLGIDGVEKVDASTDQQAAVEYDAAALTVMDLIRALRREGFLAGME